MHLIDLILGLQNDNPMNKLSKIIEKLCRFCAYRLCVKGPETNKKGVAQISLEESAQLLFR